MTIERTEFLKRLLSEAERGSQWPDVDIEAWAQDIIAGPAGMNTYEEREHAVFPKGDRIAAAEWTIRCLANPRNPESGLVLAAIFAQRTEKAKRILSEQPAGDVLVDMPQGIDMTEIYLYGVLERARWSLTVARWTLEAARKDGELSEASIALMEHDVWRFEEEVKALGWAYTEALERKKAGATT